MLKKENWTVTWKSAGITAGLFALTTVVCALLQRLGLNEISQLRNETYVPLVYVLCVLLVSLLTDGYLCGTVVSLLSVFAVNYVFTYPYMDFDFSLSGYPLTFLTMLAVSLTVNTLTATLKRQERIRMEAETERMRANLLRAISHDLRTPLTAISGSAITLLENDNLPDWQKKKLLGSINDDAEWLIRMVENLLSVTRIGLESARIEKQDEVAEEVIFSAISKFKAHFPGVAVTPQLPESVMLVPMDPVLIQQVLTNLLENSATAAQRRSWSRSRGRGTSRCSPCRITAPASCAKGCRISSTGSAFCRRKTASAAAARWASAFRCACPS